MGPVLVRLQKRTYPIHIGGGLLRKTGQLAKAAGLVDRHWVIVTQRPIFLYHGEALTQSLKAESLEYTVFTTPPSKSSEASKTQSVWLKLIKQLSACDGKNRSLGVLAFGGGVVGDLAGFAAAVYRRGIPCLQVPTTLTAQVDSSIGGKNGIDLPQGKNLLGTIYQPSAVIVDPTLLNSLGDRYWSDGSAEIIKYGVIKDPALFGELERSGLEGLKKNSVFLERVIQRCAKIKASVVSMDEHDKTGERMILNFGHTSGHAIEAVSQFSNAYTHGEAVGIGMLVACDIAKSLGLLTDTKLAQRLETLLMKFRLPLYYKALPTEALLKAIGFDKKSLNKKNRFVLPVKLGKVITVKDIPREAIVQALENRKR